MAAGRSEPAVSILALPLFPGTMPLLSP